MQLLNLRHRLQFVLCMLGQRRQGSCRALVSTVVMPYAGTATSAGDGTLHCSSSWTARGPLTNTVPYLCSRGVEKPTPRLCSTHVLTWSLQSFLRVKQMEEVLHDTRP